MIWKTDNSKYSRFLFYLLFGVIALYFNRYVERTDFLSLISCYTGLFVLYILLLRNIDASGANISEVIIAAIAIRLLMIANIPNLSDDFYRFIWDGAVNAQHINPYVFTPESLVAQLAHTAGNEWLANGVFSNLNSQAYFSIYPPVCQWIFTAADLMAGDSVLLHVVFLKLCIVLFESGTLLLIAGILKRLQLSVTKASLYALNPLVIIELSGNIHMEGIMIFFVLLAIYLILNENFLLAAVSLGLSISVKLWPLMLLPLMFHRYPAKDVVKVILIASLTVVLTFLPYAHTEMPGNYFSSFRLYFQTFEFNASIYYLLKWIIQNNYNHIVFLQRLLPVLLAALLLLPVWMKRIRLDFITLSLCAFTLYFLFATTVHAWYLTPLIALANFTRFRYPIFWSFLICFTYIAYTQIPYKESMPVVAVEYIALFGVMGYEVCIRPVSRK